MIKTLVTGALGRMGRETLKAVHNSKALELCAAVDINPTTQTLGQIIGAELALPMHTELSKALEAAKPRVVVDFTRPDVVMTNLRLVNVVKVIQKKGKQKKSHQKKKNINK